MAGDVGFDPFGFSSTFNIKWLREAEARPRAEASAESDLGQSLGIEDATEEERSSDAGRSSTRVEAGRVSSTRVEDPSS